MGRTTVNSAEIDAVIGEAKGGDFFVEEVDDAVGEAEPVAEARRFLVFAIKDSLEHGVSGLAWDLFFLHKKIHKLSYRFVFIGGFEGRHNETLANQRE